MIRVLETAEDDLVDGYRFYESQEPGVGEHFLNSIFADIDSLRRYAGIHKIIRGKYRMLARKFPFAIFYTIADDMIEVRAVLDLRRNPTWIRKRLDRE